MSPDTAVRRKLGYADVAESLRRQIEDGNIREGSLLPTERELTARYDVSRTTVRRGLQHLIDQGWAESSPNKGVLARSGPRRLLSKNVAYIDHSYTLNRYLFLALNQKLQAKGYNLVHVDSHVHGPEGAFNYAAEQGFACTVVWPKNGGLDRSLLNPRSLEAPVIALQHRFLNVPSDLVTEDNYQGGWLAATHLARQGRKRIAVTGMVDMLSTNHRRFSGYMMALFESGLKANVADYAFCLTSGMDHPDMTALENRLSAPDRPDAVFVLDDYLVPHVAESIARTGLRVPDDIAVVAFGNDVPHYFGSYGLTTVSIDWDEVAETVARQVVARLEGNSQPPATRALPVELIVRGSCGAPRKDWQEKAFFSHANNRTFAPPQLATELQRSGAKPKFPYVSVQS